MRATKARGLKFKSPLQVDSFVSEPPGTRLVQHKLTQNSKKNSVGRRRLPQWTLEMLSLVLSILAFAAIVITLAVHHDRPLPEWPNVISVNALIAIFTAILKASLLLPVSEGINRLKWLWYNQPRPLQDLADFDTASRGPLGSFRLLFTMRQRAFYNIAALGALITIVALAIDPFSQQIIHYYSCRKPVEGAQPSLAITNIYADGFSLVNDDSSVITSPTMNAAIYVGLLDPPANSSSSLKFDCPTGNCTFPASNGASYSSLAICSRCSDISDSIRNETHLGDGPVVYNYTIPGVQIMGPNDVILGSAVVPTEYNIETAQSIVDINFLMMNASNQGQVLDRPFASKCSLYACVNTYGANITDGVLQETLFESEPLLVSGPYYWYFSLATKRALKNGVWHNCTPTDQATAENDIPFTYEPLANLSMDLPNANATNTSTTADAKWYPNYCLWELGFVTNLGLVNAMSMFFNQQTVTINNALPNGGGFLPLGEAWMVNLWHNGTANLETFQQDIRGLANSLSLVVRQQGANSSQALVSGTVWGTQTCIHVEWAWLSLPAALLILTIVFFATTLLQTKKSFMRYVWRSSTLALLFQPFRFEDLDRRAFETNRDLEEKARHMSAQMEYFKGRWELRECKAAKETVHDSSASTLLQGPQSTEGE